VPTVRRRRVTVVTTYTPADLLASRLGDFITQPEPTDDGEQRMFCPRCEEPGISRTPSASINAGKGKWHCLGKCGEGGSISALAREVGTQVRGTSTREPGSSKKRSMPAPLEDQDKPHDWGAQLLRGGGVAVARVREALDDKGILPETRSRAYLGASGDQLTIPMRERGASPWVQVKFIRYDRDGGKAVTQTPGAVAMLWPAEWLDEHPTLPVLLTEGETDCLLGEQESEGRYVAVAVTGGAGTVPINLSRLSGREVFIAFDLDDAGRAGAQKMLTALREVGARAHILDLARLGVIA